MKESALLNISIQSFFIKKYKYGPMKIRSIHDWMPVKFVVESSFLDAINQFKSKGYIFRENIFIPSKDAEQIFLIYGEGNLELDNYTKTLIKCKNITPVHFTDKEQIENIVSKIIFEKH